MQDLQHSALGKSVEYLSQYNPSLLFAVPRAEQRKAIGVSQSLPFFGADIWNAYELSWLNSKGKPQVAIAEICIPCQSAFLIESKSLKLYFNSFNQHRFHSFEAVHKAVAEDLSARVQDVVTVRLIPLDESINRYMPGFIQLAGTCIDEMDIATECYQPNPDFLKTENRVVHEQLYSHLLKSNCLITGQPDWASVWIEYEGPAIDHEGLLRYIISYREHQGFHEQCVEHIYMDILRRCKPEKLTVCAYYTRRGGIDINPFRSNFSQPVGRFRLVRQ